MKKLIFKRTKLDLPFFLKVLIITNFLVVFSVIFLHPIPKYYYSIDTPTHIKFIELIKKDFKYIGYFNTGFYPKGFHLINAALSFFMPVGTAIALSTTVFGALLIIFSYKLAFFISKNKTQSLMTALLVSGIDLIYTFSIPSTVPQTFALALIVMTIYFFLKEDWIKGGIILGLYSIIHLSFPLAIILMSIIAVIELFKHNKTKLFTLIKIIAVMLIFLLPLIFLQYYYITGVRDREPMPKIMFYDEMISPLKLLSITNPFGIIILALIGMYIYRKKILEQNYLLIFLWFIIPVALSQAYWLTDSGLQLWFIAGSRTLIFFIFPLAFFSSKVILILKRKEIIIAASIIIFAFSVSNSFGWHKQQPIFDKYDLEIIEHLKKDGKIDKIIATDLGMGAIDMSLNREASPRDTWLTFVGYHGNLVDENRIDYILLGKEEYRKNYELFKYAEKNFENNNWVLLKIGEKIKFKKSKNLELYLISFAEFFNANYQDYGIENPYFIKVISEDSNEILCFKAFERISVEKCPKKVDFIIKGQKENIIELFNFYKANFRSYFKLKLLYMYRNKMLSFSSHFNPFFKSEDIEYLSYIKKWTSTSPYSQPNEEIAKFVWKLDLR